MLFDEVSKHMDESDLVDMVHQRSLEQDDSSSWENRSAGTPKWNLLFASFC